MKSTLKIGIIGAGNVGTQLAMAMEQQGHLVTVVSSRNQQNAEKLCYNLYNATLTNSLDLIDYPADIYFLTVPDNAVEAVALLLNIPETSVLVHTSGSLPLSAISITHPQTGVLYPLQTITKQHPVEWKNVWLCVEGSHTQVTKTLTTLARAITKKVIEMDTEQRAVLHLAAVMACNFTNHMFTLASALLNDHQLDFGLLKDLVIETTQKAFAMPPAEAQTGPAVRNDTKTIKKQISFLEAIHPPTAELYRKITESIHNWHLDD